MDTKQLIITISFLVIVGILTFRYFFVKPKSSQGQDSIDDKGKTKKV